MDITDKPKNYNWKVLAGIVILVGIVVFSVQNSTQTPVKLLMFEGTAPLVILLVSCFALGLCFALLIIWPLSRNSKRKTKLIESMQVRIDTLEEQLNRKDTPNI